MQTYGSMSGLPSLCLPTAQSHRDALPLTLPEESFAPTGPVPAGQHARAFQAVPPLSSHHSVELGSFIILPLQSLSAHTTSAMEGRGPLSSPRSLHQTLPSRLKLSPLDATKS